MICALLRWWWTRIRLTALPEPFLGLGCLSPVSDTPPIGDSENFRASSWKTGDEYGRQQAPHEFFAPAGLKSRIGMAAWPAFYVESIPTAGCQPEKLPRPDQRGAHFRDGHVPWHTA
jgi:hypothetical protein